LGVHPVFGLAQLTATSWGMAVQHLQLGFGFGLSLWHRFCFHSSRFDCRR